MLTWEVPERVLAPLAPPGTEVDLLEGKAYASLVGFLFLDARLLGVPVPGHRDFPEVNLRHYVRRGERHGVAFAKELVPRRALAWVARAAYGENYRSVPMRWRADEARVEYAWTSGGREHALSARPSGAWRAPRKGALEAFVVEHLHGYVRGRRGGGVEYEVEHPSWRVRDAADVRVDVDAPAEYGELGRHLRGPPASALLAEGSPVRVRWPRRVAA